MKHTILPCLLALALLSGCASTQNQEPETITIEQPVERTAVTLFTDDTSGYFGSIAARLHERDDSLAPTVTIAGTNAADELRTLLLSGQAPNVVWLSPENDRGIYRALKEDDALFNLNPLVDEEARMLSSLYTGDSVLPFYEGFLSSPDAVQDGKVVGLPMTYEAAGLLVLEENFSKVPAKFSALLALGQENGPAVFGYPQDFPAFLEPFALPFFSVSGETLRLSAADWTAEDLAGGDAPGALRQAAERLSGLTPYLFTAEPQAGLEQTLTAFAKGELWFLPGDAAIAAVLQEEYEVKAPRLAAVPTEEEPYLFARPTSFLYLPAAAPHPDAGLRLALLALSEEYFAEMAGSLGFLPPLEGSAAHLQGYAGEAAALFQNGVTAYCGSFAEGEEDSELFERFYLSLSELLQGEITADAWADGMQEALFEEDGQEEEGEQEKADEDSSSAA